MWCRVSGGGDGRSSGRANALGAALALVALLSAPSARAFRTGEDSPGLAGKGRVAWADDRVEFYLSRSGLPDAISEKQAEKALASALSAWAAPDCSAVGPRFVGWTDEAAAPGDGVNTIAWVTDWQRRGLPEAAPGNTDIAYRGKADAWHVAEADVLLNAEDFDWATLSTEAVLTHELGHALGLQHPCEPGGQDGVPACENASAETQASVMYPLYDPTHATLGTDDVAGICYLYPANQECGGQCGARDVCIDGACHPTCGDAVCEVGESCGFWGCAPAGSCLERDCTGQRCKNADACGPLQRCESGICKSGASPWGDSCSGNADCADGACVAGVCQPLCQAERDCGSRGQCEKTDDGRATACIASGAYEMGTRCAIGEDCQSGICVLTQQGNACTIDCSDGTACPADWKCDTVQKRRVCVPPAPSSGCSLTRPPGARASAIRIWGPGTSGSAAWMLVATALMVTRKLRRKKQA